jgi:hypothetical protein
MVPVGQLKPEYYAVGAIVDTETGEEIVKSACQIGDAVAKIQASSVKKVEIIERVNDPIILNTIQEDGCVNYEQALLKIYGRLRPGNPPHFEKAKTLFAEKFFDANRYRLGKVGRFRINRKFEQNVPEDVMTLRAEDILGSLKYVMDLRAGKGYVKVPVRQIVYLATGQGMYMTDGYFESIGETFKPSAILVKWDHQPDKAFLDSDYVDEYVDRTSQIKDVKSSTKVVYIAAILLIFMGGILAFVVLYNSSILNFSERIRDLTTLKVLGFYQKEIRSLVLTENILSVVLGSVFGIPVGKVIADLAASGLDDQMDLLGHISFSTIALSGLITFIFALIINSIVAEKMKKIDMLESLKSVE